MTGAPISISIDETLRILVAGSAPIDKIVPVKNNKRVRVAKMESAHKKNNVILSSNQLL